MPDREKVIKGLEVCLKNIDQPDCPNDCPYINDCSKYENRVVFQPLMRDALALLKEQEAVEPIKMQRMDGNFSFFVPYFLCGNCRYKLIGKDVMFCSHCGRTVKWE